MSGIKSFVPFKKVGTSITPKVAGDALDATIIGSTTPAAGNFTDGDFSGAVQIDGAGIIDGQVSGALFNNQMSAQAAFQALGLTTSPKFMNFLCEDPGAGAIVDVSGEDNDGAYEGGWTSGDRVAKGFGWMLDPDGTNDYIDLGDSDDFSFGDGSNDVAFTIAGVFEVIAGTAYQMLIAKYDTGNSLMEWYFAVSSTEVVRLNIYDGSTGAYHFVISSVLEDGFYDFVVTYDGSGGADADDGMNMYISGCLDNATKSNTVGDYTAMEASNTPCTIGSRLNSGVVEYPFIGDFVPPIIDKGVVWSAADVWRYHQLMKWLYNL